MIQSSINQLLGRTASELKQTALPINSDITNNTQLPVNTDTDKAQGSQLPVNEVISPETQKARQSLTTVQQQKRKSKDTIKLLHNVRDYQKGGKYYGSKND